MTFPLWATPARRACLVEIALANPLAYEIDLFTGNLTNPTIEELIDYWKCDDRGERSYLWKLERRRLHALHPRISKRGPFDSIRREQYLAERPIFHIVAIGVNAFTQRRVAQVVIPDLEATLWVDISGISREVSKSKLRKLARYRRGAVPKELVDQIHLRCRRAVEQRL